MDTPYLTQHALVRYRQRVNPDATRVTVEALLTSGVYASRWRGHVGGPRVSDGYIVVPHGAFTLLSCGDGTFRALTFLPKVIRTKAERRAYREDQREEAMHA